MPVLWPAFIILRIILLWRKRWVRRACWLVGLGGLAAVLVLIIIALVVPVTDLVAAHDVSALARPLRASQLQAARESARAQLLTLGAGVFAAGALVFTARNFTVSRRTFELAEQGQVTARYTAAVEQLGSKNRTVRTGGIYALERVARDSVRDQFTVMEVLAAFIRDRSRKQRPGAESSTEGVPFRTRLDLQAAITVIGRRNPAIAQRIDLAGADLAGADLSGADLSGADLAGADLSGADLAGADLSGANLTKARLIDAKLHSLFRASSDAHLDFTTAQLARADITATSPIFPILGMPTSTYRIRTDLSEADLGADLTGADLTGAKLNRADLTDAKLDGTRLMGADLVAALFPPDFALPKGWVRDLRSGGRLRRASEDTDGAAS